MDVGVGASLLPLHTLSFGIVGVVARRLDVQRQPRREASQGHHYRTEEVFAKPRAGEPTSRSSSISPAPRSVSHDLIAALRILLVATEKLIVIAPPVKSSRGLVLSLLGRRG